MRVLAQRRAVVFVSEILITQLGHLLRTEPFPRIIIGVSEQAAVILTFA